MPASSGRALPIAPNGFPIETHFSSAKLLTWDRRPVPRRWSRLTVRRSNRGLTKYSRQAVHMLCSVLRPATEGWRGRESKLFAMRFRFRAKHIGGCQDSCRLNRFHAAFLTEPIMSDEILSGVRLLPQSGRPQVVPWKGAFSWESPVRASVYVYSISSSIWRFSYSSCSRM